MHKADMRTISRRPYHAWHPAGRGGVVRRPGSITVRTTSAARHR
jgi:hypothetical protein